MPVKRRRRQIFPLSSFVFNSKDLVTKIKTKEKSIGSRLASINFTNSLNKNLLEINLQLESHKYRKNLFFHKRKNSLKQTRFKYLFKGYKKKLDNFSVLLKTKKRMKRLNKNMFNKVVSNSFLYRPIQLKRSGSYSSRRRFKSFLI
jgi:hypothetical protein